MTPTPNAAAYRFGFTAVASIALAASMLVPSYAGMRDRMKAKMMDSVADTMVSTIQTDSCPEFAAMMANRKSGGDDSSKSSKMKSDPAARQRFVDKVAGPLLNKMIDCDMLPSN
jgi:hypothetical protein